MDQDIEDMIEEFADPFDLLVADDGEGDDGEDAPRLTTFPEEPPFRIPKGKYKGLLLPRAVGIKPSHFDRVLALKDEITRDPEFQRQAGTIAQTYVALRREAAAKALELTEIRTRMSAAMLLMIEQFDIEGTGGVTLKNGDKIRVDVGPHLVVEDREQFRLWCVAQGLAARMTLAWGTANKLVKAMLKDGQPEPPGTTTYAYPKVVFTPGSK